MPDTTDLVSTILSATFALPADVRLVPARFALITRDNQDPRTVAASVAGALAPLGATVRPLSVLEPNILLAEIPGRILRADDSSPFDVAYMLADHFDLEAAEPDLPTDFFPDVQPRPVEGPHIEGLEDFPPGCWAPAQPELEERPRWALEKMHVPEAWAYSLDRGRPAHGAGIVVAQPDTGLAPHVELDGILRVAGYDFVDRDDQPVDPLNYSGNPGHGTGTASVLVSPEPGRVCGSAPAARHMAIRAIESVVRITQVSVAEAIEFAVANGAHVITMSLGGIPSFSLHRALRRAVAADVIVLAAAGNCVGTVVWPARYDDCIAVAGTNWKDEPWRGSCRGAAVDISAPAENVFRARAVKGETPGAQVGQGQGTSFAVALTAGVAALWLAHHGRANLIAAARARGETVQAMFRRLLRATARRPEPPTTWDAFSMGAGIVDARTLLAADFDLGRDREAAEGLPLSATEGAALSVQSLVVETLRKEVPEAVDWSRFGPEIAMTLLHRRMQVAAESAGLRREAALAGEPTAVSSRLAEAVTAPALRAALGLSTEGAAQ